MPRSADGLRDRVPRPTVGDVAGAFGDLAVLVPLAAGLVVLAGVEPGGFFVTFGLATLLAGLAFRLPMPVQPQKAIAAAAIAEGWRATQVYGAALGMGVLWLALAATPLLTWLRRVVPVFVARGIQLALAFVLGIQAVALLITSAPLAVLALLLLVVTLRYRTIGVLLTGLIALALMPRDALGLVLTPTLPALALPTAADTLDGLARGGVAQMPLTLANAIIATAALTARYFPGRAPSERQLAVSTGLMNVGGAVLGGGPLCHGAGGLAAQYFYGARTIWKNVFEAALAIGLGLFFAPGLAAALALFPLPLLGGLLLLVALELLSSAQGLYGWQGWIATGTAVVGAAWNIGAAFVAGLIFAYAVRYGVHRGWLPRLTGATPAELLARIPQRLFPIRAA
ncbi:MAG: molybdate transporter family protein [Candidatus Limnocylindria bacterium]